MKKTWPSVLALLLAASLAPAQDQPPAPSEGAPRKVTPLRVQFVFTRYQGERKVSSLPYTLTCSAAERPGARASLRVGIDVPLVTKVDNVPQVVFKSVGTAVDCMASEPTPGLYKLDLNTEQSSIHSPEAGSRLSDINPGHPVLRNFRASFSALLRDGQTIQYVSSTDPVNGEVVKLDVTVNVVK